jgi:energy-converting hydrogenase Eha subunit B
MFFIVNIFNIFLLTTKYVFVDRTHLCSTIRALCLLVYLHFCSNYIIKIKIFLLDMCLRIQKIIPKHFSTKSKLLGHVFKNFRRDTGDDFLVYSRNLVDHDHDLSTLAEDSLTC